MVGGEKRLPQAVRCFDTARIYIKSGDGGAGCVAFRREPFVEKGGPNGGNGGRGGNVWAVADEATNSLLPFRNQAHFRAHSGVAGKGAMQDGANGDDLEIRVPLGTIIRRKDADEADPPLAELLIQGQRALLLVGGRGGRGNLSFKTGKNTAPAFAERGEAGREEYVDLELKVVADVGIVGVPNAGKSTLLSVLTAARPKIANYPFTTLVPNLGVCEMDFRTTVFADVPGLLEGAHEGHGLGHQFLRHVQRCRALVHVLDGTSPDPVGDYKAICLELELFNPELREKPQVVAYNKTDVPESGDYWEFVREYLVEEEGLDPSRVLPISAVTGRGVADLVRAVRSVLDELGPATLEPSTDALNRTTLPKRFDSEMRIDRFTVEKEPMPLAGGEQLFYVRGDAIERFAQMTNWDYYEAVRRFQRILDVSGISQSLRDAGIKEGDSVALGDVGEFAWSEERGEAAVYDAWLEDMKARGRNRQGVSAWPGAK
ncbi:MAG: GTP1/OBG-domain-containing protein [Monoraphidium minutum]|nr:MAG: GTP1/OBG-domain-containing protein [Monoraphidium minutum]